jgi:hypothetical protein
MGTTTIRKRCEKCGATSDVAPRERRCKTVTTGFGGTLRYCWGSLKRIPKRKVKRTLEQELSAAHAQLADAITRVKRATTSVDHWQRKIKYIGRRIDERDHPTPKIKKPRHVRTRLITLPDDEDETL